VGYRGNINIKKDDFDKLVAAFSSMPVSAANGIQNIVRKRDNHNNAGDELLPILPMQFMKIDKRTFIDNCGAQVSFRIVYFGVLENQNFSWGPFDRFPSHLIVVIGEIPERRHIVPARFTPTPDPNSVSVSGVATPRRPSSSNRRLKCRKSRIC
jgi:hypothetical protein